MTSYTSLVSQTSGAGEFPTVTSLFLFDATTISSISSPVTLLPAPGSNSFYVVDKVELIVDRDSQVVDVDFSAVTGAGLTTTVGAGASVTLFQPVTASVNRLTSMSMGSPGIITCRTSSGFPFYHLLEDGYPIKFTSVTLPGFTANTTYYVNKLSDNTFSLYTDPLLTTPVVSNANSKNFTDTNVSVGTNNFSITAHSFTLNDAVTFTEGSGGSLPAPLVAGTTYYISSPATNSFTVSAVPGAGAIDLTTAGTAPIVNTVAATANARVKIKTFNSAAVNDTLNTISVTEHALPINTSVVFTTDSTLPAPLVAHTTYFVAPSGPILSFMSTDVNSGTEEITIPSHGLSTGDAIRFRAGSTGSLPGGLSVNTTYYASVVNSNTIKVTTLQGGAVLNLTSAGTVGVTNYVASATTSAFKVASSSNGAPIDLTSAGTGNHTVQSNVSSGTMEYSIPGGFPRIYYFYPRTNNDLQGLTTTSVYDPTTDGVNLNGKSFPNGFSVPVSTRAGHTPAQVASLFKGAYVSISSGQASIKSTNPAVVRIFSDGGASIPILSVTGAPESDNGLQPASTAAVVTEVNAASVLPTPYTFSVACTNYISKSIGSVGRFNSFLTASGGGNRVILGNNSAFTMDLTGIKGGPDGDLILRVTYRVFNHAIPAFIGI